VNAELETGRDRRSMVRIIDPAMAAQDGERRAFLHRILHVGASVPVLYALLDAEMAAAAGPPNATHELAIPPAPPAAAIQTHPALVVRTFSDPYLELLRLLREACEVEHALMLQYLYAAFSLKPAYHAIAGAAAPGSDTLLGVAIQEMEHLACVNRLLVALGAAPNLLPAEFPYEPDIYPFEFNLEPLTPKSLAKYVYVEAPIGYFDGQVRGADGRLIRAVLDMIGRKRRPNHIGSLYAAIIALVREVGERPAMPDMKPWVAKLEAIKEEGEVHHFAFFKSLFLASHPGFGGRANAWELAVPDANYPSYAMASNPTAYIGHENQVHNAKALALAWLADLHYWTALLLLDQYFRNGDPAAHGLALAHMMGPLLALGRHLPKLGIGVPFDPLNLGTSPGIDGQHNRRLITALLEEIVVVSKRVEDSLPADYAHEVTRQSLAAMREESPAFATLAR